MKLANLMKEGKTYQVIPTWSNRDKQSYYVKVAKDLSRLEANQYTCVIHDDLQVLELGKKKSRTMFLPYHSIRYIEQSPAADVASKLFG